jgi:hypothetical protein
MYTAHVVVLTLLICLSCCADPSPPMWDTAFAFAGSAEIVFQGKLPQIGTVQYYYKWAIPAVLQVNANTKGEVFNILHVKNNTWRVQVGTQQCCLCTNEYSCSHVTPPRPDWLQTGAEYIGVDVITERECNGWTKTDPVAKFGWWTSTKTGIPCQLAWLLGFNATMSMSFYTNDLKLIPDYIFEIPSYCPLKETEPNCGISGFTWPGGPPGDLVDRGY